MRNFRVWVLAAVAFAVLTALPAYAWDWVPTTQVWSEVDASHRFSPHWGGQLDVQYARQSDIGGGDLVQYNQQLAIRPWLHYYPNRTVRVSAFAGLWYNYGIPEVGQRAYPEFRVALQTSLYSPLPGATLANRVRLEGRDIRDRAGLFEQVLRLRYQIKVVRPFDGEPIHRGSTYGVAFDEVFLNGGSDVTGHHAFDQNRLFVGLGHAFTDDVAVEVGYFNQIQQEKDGVHMDINHILQVSLMLDDVLRSVLADGPS